MSSLNDILGRKAESPTQPSTQPIAPSERQEVQAAIGASSESTQRDEDANLRKNGAVPTTQPGKINIPTTTIATAVPNVVQQVTQKGEEHPSVSTTPATTVDRQMSYEDIYKQLNPFTPPTKEQLDKERKKEKREKIFAAIGDGISALSNLYFTTKGAPNMYNHRNSQSDKVESKWEKLRADRDAKMSAYVRDIMNAKQADEERNNRDRAWMRQLNIDIYNQAKDAEEAKYKKDRDDVKDDQWKQAFDQKEQQFKETQGLKKETLEETKRTHKANEELKETQIAETSRHNRVSEAQGAAKISQSESHFRATHNADGTTKGTSSGSSSSKSTGKQETIRLHDGSVHTYSPEKKGALTSLAPSMIRKAKAASERYRKSGDRKNAQHYAAIADALEKTKSRDGIAALVVSNVGDFPSMDSDVRSLIGVTGTPNTGGFNVNSYRRGTKKTTKKMTTSTNRPPLN